MATVNPSDSDDRQHDQYSDRVSFVLLDSDVVNRRNNKQKLRSINNKLEIFENVPSCLKYIEKLSEKERIVLVVTAILGRELIPLIHEFQHVIAIYIYCLDKTAHVHWSSEFTKVKDVVTDIYELVHQLKAHYNLQKEIIKERLRIKIFEGEGTSTTELNGKFINSQVLIDCLLRLPLVETDKEELITLYKNEYRENKNELKYLDEFQKAYSPEKAIWWYTRESFFYRTINTALRSDNIHIIFLLRSFIFDVQQQLQKYQCQNRLKVYRSQIMSKDEFKMFRQSETGLISVNSFFSTSKDRMYAIYRLGDTNSTVNWERILFEIDADPKTNKTKPFADITQLSYFPDENEILFMTGTIFRVDKISCHENQIWIVQMTLCGDDQNHLKDVLKETKKQIGKFQPNLLLLGKFLKGIGEFDLAERYFKRLLDQLSSDDLLRGDVYDELAKVSSQNEKHDESIKWREEHNKFKQKYLLSCSTRSLKNLIHIKRSNLNVGQEIGSGGFGRVYQAKLLTDDTTVAMKTLHPIRLNGQEEIVFLNELLLLYRIRHPNIVTFYGACLDNDFYALVMEYMSLGSLYHVLHEKKLQLSWPHRYSVASQAAKALNYLHQSQPQILHRDIKSSNLLLENHHSEYLVKVCDFGMAQTRNDTTSQTQANISMAFTLSWAAPEVLDLHPFTEKSDVYSLAIVFWELATYQKPYDGNKNNVISQFVLSGRRLKIPDSTPSNFRNIIEKCWAQKPDDRPTCVDLIKMLNKCNENPDQTNFQLKTNLNWKQYAKTIAGEVGQKLNQLFLPCGIYLDHKQQSIYIADRLNHRIVKWKFGKCNGQVIAGGNGLGNRLDQLNCPTDVILDRNNEYLIISDQKNRRVVRWSLNNPQDRQIIISDIDCRGLAMNDNEDLFVSDYTKHEVKRWRKGELEGTVVAGGNGQGNQSNQFNTPTFIFVDCHNAIYVSDKLNHRVMKWVKRARKGIVVAGGQGQGNGLNQLDSPRGVSVNQVGDVYVADWGNHRIVCWPSESKEGRLVVGGNGQGQGSNQFNHLMGLAFDQENNLYIVDEYNHRIQRFDVDKR